MADCTQKLHATIGLSAAVESWQTGFNSLIVQHVRFFWADGCSTRCDLFILVPRCSVSRCPPWRYGAKLSGLAMSGLAISAPPSIRVVVFHKVVRRHYLGGKRIYNFLMGNFLRILYTRTLLKLVHFSPSYSKYKRVGTFLRQWQNTAYTETRYM